MRSPRCMVRSPRCVWMLLCRVLRGANSLLRLLPHLSVSHFGVGENKQVRMHIPPRSLEYWSVAENRWVRSSDRKLRVGGSSTDLKLESVAK